MRPSLNALHAAAIAAPRLRNLRSTRKITTLDAAGNAIRVVTQADVVKSGLVRLGIEFDVPGAPWWTCDQCRQMFERGKGKGRPRPPSPQCATCGCDLRRSVMTPTVVAERKGQPPRCRSCYLRWLRTDRKSCARL